jgi:hypothetical protein
MVVDGWGRRSGCGGGENGSRKGGGAIMTMTVVETVEEEVAEEGR